MTSIKFGTDGWRAIIAEDFTFDNVRIVSQAVANYLRQVHLAERGVVVGYDTRFASENFAAAVAEVMAGNGIVCYLCDAATPTPTISYGVLSLKAGGGVVITASHNPGEWNGFKYKPDYAGSASPEIVAELERHIETIQSGGEVLRLDHGQASAKGLIKLLNPRPLYFEQVGKLIDLEYLRSAGIKVVHDAMYGAGAGYFEALLAGGRTQVIGLHQERNPIFPGIRPEPIAVNLKRLSRSVRRRKAQLGIATDGDSDRVGIVAENGEFVNQLQVFGLLALYLLEVRGWRGGIVKSLSTTSMINKLGTIYGVPVEETPVGFKHIGPKMLASDSMIGGEESGGFGFRGHIPERDGIVAGLMIADMSLRLGRTPSELVSYLYEIVGPHYYDRVDLDFPAELRGAILRRIADANPSELDGVPVVHVNTADGFKYTLGDGSWLLIRFSGTEPIMRVYTETNRPERVRRILREGVQLAGLEKGH